MDLGTASTLLSIAIHLVVGTRLLLLARRTIALPELLIGGGLFLVGAAKTLGMTLGSASWVGMLSMAWTSVSHLLFFLVWWYVFRRHTWWAIALCLGAGGTMAAVFAYQIHLGWEVSFGGWSNWYNYIRTHVAGAGFAWGAVECLLYYSRLRKRIPFGLAKPSTAWRFLLWGTSMAATLVIVFALHARHDYGLLSETSLQVIWVAMNLVSGVSLWFSFLLPVALRNYLDRGVKEEAAA